VLTEPLDTGLCVQSENSTRLFLATWPGRSWVEQRKCRRSGVNATTPNQLELQPKELTVKSREILKFEVVIEKPQ
jgi:hypothetical protein